ncbi:MAG: succinylglutamate desuccinylase [Flavobacterium sp.]|jgi:succinylglutamate desuccinylase
MLYETSLQQFIETGDLLSLTLSHPKLQSLSTNIPWKNCRVCLLDTGVLLVEPDVESSVKLTDQKNIVISAGIHGNETAPIEMVSQLTQDIACGDLEVQHRILFIIGNPEAMSNGTRFIHENLNRLFQTKNDATTSSKDENSMPDNIEYSRSLKLRTYLELFFRSENNVHYDLHTAIRESIHEKFAIYPHQTNKPYSTEQLQFLYTAGINTVLFSHAPAATFSYYSSKLYNAHAFTIELGKVRKFGENDMGKFTKISNALQDLMSNKLMEIKPFRNEDFNLFEVCHEVIKTSDAFNFYIEDNVKNFAPLPNNTLLWEDKTESYRTNGDKEAVVFPNPNVPIGQRVALVIRPRDLSNN